MSERSTTTAATAAGWFTVVLLVVALVEAIALWRLCTTPEQALSHAPLIEVGGADSRSLAAPGGTRRAADARLVGVGTVLTVEDVARGLLLLVDEDHPQSLTAEQRAALLPLVRRAHELRRELLQTEQRMGTTRHDAERLGAAVENALSPAQRQAMRTRRDELSIEGVENPYWESLIAALESTP